MPVAQGYRVQQGTDDGVDCRIVVSLNGLAKRMAERDGVDDEVRQDWYAYRLALWKALTDMIDEALEEAWAWAVTGEMNPFAGRVLAEARATLAQQQAKARGAA